MSSPDAQSNNAEETAILPLIDIGANLTDRAFDKDRHDEIRQSLEHNVRIIILTGTDQGSSEQAFELSQQYPNYLYSTAGIHPHHAHGLGPEIWPMLYQLSQEKSVIAIGETGLDFYRDLAPRKTQEQVFEAHIELAIKTQLPMFLHQREAHNRFYEIIKHYRDELSNAVVHCFTDNKKALFDYLDLDLHIGITGWVCDERRGQDLQSIVNNIPLNRLMVETDSPYLIPRTLRPKPKSRRNTPRNLHHITQQLALHSARDYAEVAHSSTATALKFFQIELPPPYQS